MSDRPVFISYARTDSKLVDAVYRKLKWFGVDVWQDVRRLNAGDKWAPELIKAIGESLAFILIVTRASAKSAWVQRECEEAKKVGARVIPVRMEEVPLPERLNSIQWLDLTAKRKPWTRLADALNETTVKKKGPKLTAEMWIKDGEPQYAEGDELHFQLRIKNAPFGTRVVKYQLHSDEFDEDYANESSKNMKDRFELERQSYGDILISARMVAGGREFVVRDTLFKMLSKTHGRDRRPGVVEALEQIRDF